MLRPTLMLRRTFLETIGRSIPGLAATTLAEIPTTHQQPAHATLFSKRPVRAPL